MSDRASEMVERLREVQRASLLSAAETKTGDWWIPLSYHGLPRELVKRIGGAACLSDLGLEVRAALASKDQPHD